MVVQRLETGATLIKTDDLEDETDETETEDAVEPSTPEPEATVGPAESQSPLSPKVPDVATGEHDEQEGDEGSGGDVTEEPGEAGTPEQTDTAGATAGAGKKKKRKKKPGGGGAAAAEAERQRVLAEKEARRQAVAEREEHARVAREAKKAAALAAQQKRMEEEQAAKAAKKKQNLEANKPKPAGQKAKGKGKGDKARKEHERKQQEVKAKREAAEREAEDRRRLADEEAIAEKKRNYEAVITSARTNVATAKSEGGKWPDLTVAVSAMEALETTDATLRKAKSPQWSALHANAMQLNTAAYDIVSRAAAQARRAQLDAAGRISANDTEIDARALAGLSGDGLTGEEDAVKEAVKGIKSPGADTWNGGGGKWNEYHGNGENNLPVGNYREYYVRPPEGVAGWGRRRIVKSSTGRYYYSWTHYGENGKPPFVLLTGH